jgi:hypothetical protein
MSGDVMGKSTDVNSCGRSILPSRNTCANDFNKPERAIPSPIIAIRNLGIDNRDCPISSSN